MNGCLCVTYEGSRLLIRSLRLLPKFGAIIETLLRFRKRHMVGQIVLVYFSRFTSQRDPGFVNFGSRNIFILLIPISVAGVVVPLM
jgi:hypothetical protein